MVPGFCGPNAADVPQDVTIHLDGTVPCRPQGLCNETHLNVLCAPPCRGTGDVAMTARDLWERRMLPDVMNGQLTARQLPPHGSLFALLARKKVLE